MGLKLCEAFAWRPHRLRSAARKSKHGFLPLLECGRGSFYIFIHEHLRIGTTPRPGGPRRVAPAAAAQRPQPRTEPKLCSPAQRRRTWNSVSMGLLINYIYIYIICISININTYVYMCVHVCFEHLYTCARTGTGTSNSCMLMHPKASMEVYVFVHVYVYV